MSTCFMLSVYRYNERITVTQCSALEWTASRRPWPFTTTWRRRRRIHIACIHASTHALTATCTSELLSAVFTATFYLDWED